MTPEDVRNAAFSDPPRGERGYNRDEVDAFLNLLEEEIRRRVTGIPRNTQPARPWNR
ncbi:DivIVA domain-containing protein [Mycobacterium haemophilum DSM 44634]|nr:DivIVA domain-containing protein [Mycobacterium haemophilum DSM 44634]